MLEQESAAGATRPETQQPGARDGLWMAPRVRGLKQSLIRVMKAACEPGDVDLTLGEPALRPHAALAQAAHTAWLSSGQGYTQNAGRPALRDAIAAHWGAGVRADDVIVTAGATGALASAVMALVHDGDRVAVPDPGYPGYAPQLGLAGGTAVPYAAAGDLTATLDALDALLTGPNPPKGVLVCSPSNPTGHVWSRDALAAIAQRVLDAGAWLISDEVYRQLYTDGHAPSMRAVTDAAWVVGGLSKAAGMTGERVGWLIAPTGKRAPALRAHQLVSTCAPGYGQLLAEHVLADTAELARHRDAATAARTHAAALAKELGLTVVQPDGAFYLWVTVPVTDTLAFAQGLLAAHRVAVVPGEAFGPAGQGKVRLSLAGDLEQTERGLRALAIYVAAAAGDRVTDGGRA